MEFSPDSKSWRDDLASLVEDSGIILPGDPVRAAAVEVEEEEEEEVTTSGGRESLKDQIKGFAAAWGEMVVELGRGLRDVVQQTVLTEDSYAVKRMRGPMAQVAERVKYLNEFLPEDRHPLHVWAVFLFVFMIALAVLNVNSRYESYISTTKKVYIHPPSAARILLSDGRYIAYHEMGVPADKARFTIVTPHGFLSSRLAGVPGIKQSLLEEFGVRVVSYDLPGFGESAPHTTRNLISSAFDMLQLADSIGVEGKFWVLGYSSGAVHAWAALKYIPDKIAGAAMLAPLVNPYEQSMTKEERSRTWENWSRRKRLMYYLARRFPNFLSYFYGRMFLSGKHGRVDKWLSVSLGKKDKSLVEKLVFEEIWHRNVEESIRQGNVKPFVEEAMLQVSNWGFSLTELQAQRKCPRKSLLPWLQFMYGLPECEMTGFLGQIHIWQGMDDMVVPPSIADYIARVLPNASVHRLPEEGHFSYFVLCDECHREILSTLFGFPRGPLDTTDRNHDVQEIPDEAADTASV
ncbi:hypothetical protein F511_04390 [Dorcoceras hygrometricum]|uniref:AB hydrolase-1 domain-containing protein n=1 Tax=Dorcoceras hygrometricum TaxID=472368 RepID=A0A2Z7BSH7_9LAMI|nr:hypothetical protein F511_04390 [Dorcoceras hygrometricum]